VLGVHVVEAVAVDELHDDVGLGVFLAVAVDLDDVGVVDGGEGAGFLQELLDEGAVLAEGLLGHLEGDGAAEGLVIGAVDGAHAALAELLQDDEVGEPRRDEPLGAAGGAAVEVEGCAGADVAGLAAFSAGDQLEGLEDDVC